LSAAAGLGLEVNECIVVEDAESGVVAAKAGGFFCYGLLHQDASTELSHTAGLGKADKVIGSLGDIDLTIFS